MQNTYLNPISRYPFPLTITKPKRNTSLSPNLQFANCFQVFYPTQPLQKIQYKH